MMERAKALDRMMALCSRREYCRKEILAKLSRLEAEDATGIVETLCKERYIDELRYATAFARDKSSLQGWGSLKIRVALQAKGIPAETISAALGEIDASAADARLTALLRNKLHALRGESDEATRYRKLLRFGLGRGYDYEQIKRIYDNLRTT